MKKQIAFLLLFSTLFLSGCGKKTPAPTPTPTPKLIELTDAEKPYISLIPRSDGHEITIKITKIPESIESMEYELIYTAVDNGLEIEKGAGDTVKSVSGSIERKVLLGTESCTNGCKYKYDTGVNGGKLNLTLITKNGQMSTMESPFSLRTAAEIKKLGAIDLPSENYSGKITTKTGEFYIMVKNALVYSVFSSSGLIDELSPTSTSQ